LFTFTHCFLPDKWLFNKFIEFQALAIGKKTFKEHICFDLNGSKIKCEEHVKLLGVTIDYELNFDKHTSEICKKSARIFDFSSNSS
jgi:hypothetical protein